MPSHFSGVVTIRSERATARMSGVTSPVNSTTLKLQHFPYLILFLVFLYFKYIHHSYTGTLSYALFSLGPLLDKAIQILVNLMCTVLPFAKFLFNSYLPIIYSFPYKSFHWSDVHSLEYNIYKTMIINSIKILLSLKHFKHLAWYFYLKRNI